MLFKIGDRIIHGGQVYFAAGLEPYTRRDGSETHLVRIVSRCAECSAEFEFRVPQGASEFSPRRRCDKHKKSGVRVSKKSWVRNIMPFVAQENVFD